MEIRQLKTKEKKPMKLLLLADPSEDNVNNYLKRGDCYVAEDNNAVVGAFVLLSTRPHTVEIINIAVAENHQGKGIGKKLVLEAINIAKNKGYQTVEIGTGNSSVGQLALYQKCGFRIIGIDFDFFIKHYQEEIYENGIQCRDMIRLSQDLY